MFAFVGISDFWEATICVFHAQHGGKTQAIDYMNVRAGSYNKTAATAAIDCNDSADQRVYQCALDVFFNRLNQFTQCKQYMSL